MKDWLLTVGILSSLVAITWFAAVAQNPQQPKPVACADIPESNEKIIIVRDGQVECHYKITKVRERK